MLSDQPDRHDISVGLTTVDTIGDLLVRVRENIGKIIYGQEEVIDLCLITLLSGGHILLIGVPGLGKTRLVEAIGTVLGMSEKRIQCTPDLMPTDIIGSEILEEDDKGRRSFRFIPGPVFCQLLMADEINRASPRTQSAFLQAMQEQHVSVAGRSYSLPEPFHVLATQNPLEYEGTYPLPEAQLDRFFMQVTIVYPDQEAERRMMIETTGLDHPCIEPVMSADQVISAQRLIRQFPIGDKVVDGIMTLVRQGRPEISQLPEVQRHVVWGPGPRASQALMLATRVRAFFHGRFAPSLDDVIALAKPILRHRMALHYTARTEGLTIDKIIERLCQEVLK